MNIELKETKAVKIVRWMESLIIGILISFFLGWVLLELYKEATIRGSLVLAETIFFVLVVFLFGLLGVMCVWEHLGSVFHLFVRRIEEGTIIMKGGELVGELSEDIFLWRWDKIFRCPYNFAGWLPHQEEIVLEIHPVTLNPKVRDIKCFLVVIRDETTEGLRNLMRILGPVNWHNWSMFPKGLLYNFAEAHSKELGELYNPLDETQQKKYSSLVHQFFDSELQKAGLKIAECSFSL